LNIWRWRGEGTEGRGLPEEVSQYSSTEVLGLRSFLSCNAVVLTRSDRSSSSFSWAAAIPSCVNGAEIGSTRESASATMLSWPDMWRVSVVNWEMKSRWLNWCD
jgi:hypothetical protein